MKSFFKSLLQRITGFSTPFFGLSWNPTATDRRIVYKLFQIIGDRRIITGEHHCLPLHFDQYEDGDIGVLSFKEFMSSVQQIRNSFTQSLQEISPDSKIRPYLERIRKNTNDFSSFLDKFSQTIDNEQHIELSKEFMLEWRNYLILVGKDLIELNKLYSLKFDQDSFVFEYLFSRVAEISKEINSNNR